MSIIQRPRHAKVEPARSSPREQGAASARRGVVPQYIRTAVVLLCLVAGCTTVPYQEMSDARQALESAQLAVGGMPGPRAMVLRAETMLDRARVHLRDRQHDDARRLAQQAKSLAIEARERAEQESQDSP